MEEEVVKVGGGQWRLEGDGKGMIAAVRKESPSSKRLMNSSNEGGREVGHVGGCERRVEETGGMDRWQGRVARTVGKDGWQRRVAVTGWVIGGRD